MPVRHAHVYEKKFKCNGNTNWILDISVHMYIIDISLNIEIEISVHMYIIDISLNIEIEYLYRWIQTQW